MDSIKRIIGKCMEALEKARSEINREAKRLFTRISTIIEENPEIKEKTLMALEGILELALEGRYDEVPRYLMVVAISLVLYSRRKNKNDS